VTRVRRKIVSLLRHARLVDVNWFAPLPEDPDERCSVTGLKLINGGGRAEVAVAHIRPVEARSPDIVNKGLALSGTAHWMFDRGLVSLSDDLDILISRQANDADGIRSFINRTGRALPPLRAYARPHPHLLWWHRENCFKP